MWSSKSWTLPMVTPLPMQPQPQLLQRRAPLVADAVGPAADPDAGPDAGLDAVLGDGPVTDLGLGHACTGNTTMAAVIALGGAEPCAF